MKKLLIITFHWPPAGGAAVQRWLKLCKYIHEYGWQPVVYTSEGADLPVEDLSLVKEVPSHVEVIRQHVWEPYHLYKIFTRRQTGSAVYSGFINEERESGLMQQLAVWIRGNLFIPDARKFWINPSIRFLSKFLQRNPVDAMVSTGPPHSVHLIALNIKKRFKLPWVVDFRDPWTRIDYFEDLMLSKCARKKHRRMEKEVLHSATSIVTVSSSWRSEFESMCKRKVNLITNGYDINDFPERKQRLDTSFSICHVGALNRDRNPKALWRALKTLVRGHHPLTLSIKVNLIGPVDRSVINEVRAAGIENLVSIDAFLPHDQALMRMQRSQLLLLLINRTFNSLGIIPVKLYEYLAAKRPILHIGPINGDCACIIKEAKAGKIADFDDHESVKKNLENWFYDFRNDRLRANLFDIEKYSHRELSRSYAKLLHRLTD